MASLTRKRIAGKSYYYLRECQRIEGRPKIVWQKYLGRVEQVVAALEQHARGADLPQARQAAVTSLGAVAALYDLAARLDLVGIIDRHVPKRGPGPSVGTYLLIATLNRCIAPVSKARVGPWFESTVLRRLLAVDARQLTSQRFWDNMNRVSAQAIRSIEEELVGRMADEFQLDLSQLLFDATNFFTFIDTFNGKAPLARRGKSKEGRQSLRIVGVALLVTSDFHVPLLHHTYPGNQTDCPTFSELIGSMSERCQRLLEGVQRVTLIFDKGNNSSANLNSLSDSPFHFVGSLVPTQHPDLLAIPRRSLKPLADAGLPGVYAYRTTKEIFGTSRTVVVTYNEALFVAQSRTLLREIGKRQQQLQELSQRLLSWRAKPTTAPRRPTMEGTRKTLDSILQGRHMKDLFQAELTEQGGLPILKHSFNNAEWERLQETLLGKTLLFTDHQDWSNAQIVRAYRAQSVVEDAFRRMKDPAHICIRPQHHWTDQKIRVHVFTCVLALALCSLLRRCAFQKGIDMSIPRLLDLLDGIREAVLVFPAPTAQGEPVVRSSLTRMNSQQQQLFEAFNLARHCAA